MSSPAQPDLDAELKRFGLSQFRPRQREVIATVLAGRDCLCVMPTGAGKSLCYQLPGAMLPPLTLVVSPLIALMKDQVDQLQARGFPVTFINSTLTLSEQYARLDDMAAGRYQMVYVVPERFRSARFLEAVRTVGLKLLAVDEAHCISEWGHDFRPDYARLGKFRKMLGCPPTIALTATATDAVRRDIIEQLDLAEPRTFITGFARPNLRYEVLAPRSNRDKTRTLVDFLRETPGSGIIYVATRKRTEEIAGQLAGELGRRTTTYHAGMLNDQRHQAQDAFMQGRAEIVVATNAFGMGIDKPDVRFVVHYNIPGTLEAYYQEAGRAGRDGRPSRCLLLYSAADRHIQEFFIDSAYPDKAHIAAVYEFLRAQQADPIQRTQQEIKDDLSLPIAAEGVGACEQILESTGVLERLIAAKNMACVRLDSDLPTLVDLLPKQAEVRRRVLRAIERIVGSRRHEMVYFHLRSLLRETEMEHDALTRSLRELNDVSGFTYVPPFRGRAIRMIRRDLEFHRLGIDFETLARRKQAEYEKLKQVEQFAMTRRCRQEEILRYFGEEGIKPCGTCDNCVRREGPKGQGLGIGDWGLEESKQGLGIRESGLEGDRRAKAPASNLRVSAPNPQSPIPNPQPPASNPQSPIPNPQSRIPNPPFSGLLTAARIILSGVARTQARIRCGKNLLSQMLCGSASAKVSKLGLDRLSTFGLLRGLTQPEVVALVDALIATGQLEQVTLEQSNFGSHRPVLELTDAGRDLMKGKAGLPEGLAIPKDLGLKLNRLKLDRMGPGSHVGESLRDSHSRQPFEAMPEVLEEPPLPTVEETWEEESLSTNQPPREVASLGETRPRDEPRPPDESRPTGGSHPDHYWTWRLLAAGFSADESAVIRGVGRNVILGHALRALEDGLPVRCESCLSQELIAVLATTPWPREPGRIRSILPTLPPGTTYDEVQLFLNCRGPQPVE